MKIRNAYGVIDSDERLCASVFAASVCRHACGGGDRVSGRTSEARQGRLWWDTLRLKTPLLGDAHRRGGDSSIQRAMAD